MYIQFGGFNECPAGWFNYEPSIYLRLSRLPIIGGLVLKSKGIEFPKDVIFGDVVKGLPIHDGEASCIYSSHVLEHLTVADCRAALKEVYRMLKKDGVFRFVVPDLQSRAVYYAENYQRIERPGNAFMQATLLGKSRARSAGLMAFARALFSTSAHQWMWDYKSICAELRDVGFSGVRRAEFGDRADPMLELVERRDRFYWAPGKVFGTDDGSELEELAVEAVK